MWMWVGCDFEGSCDGCVGREDISSLEPTRFEVMCWLGALVFRVILPEPCGGRSTKGICPETRRKDKGMKPKGGYA